MLLKQSISLGSSMDCATLSFVKMPARKKSPIPIMAQAEPVIKKVCLRSVFTIPFLVRSIIIGIMVVGIPPKLRERKLAEAIARVLSSGLGEIAADIPQKGTSLIVKSSSQRV